MLSGIIGAALLGLGATARKGPRTGFPEILEQNLFKVVSDLKRKGKSSVEIKDPLTGKVRKIPVRAFQSESIYKGSYNWKAGIVTNQMLKRQESLPSSAYYVKGDDDPFKYRDEEVIFLDDKLDFNSLISTLKHEIVHASDPSLLLQRNRKLRNNFHNYYFSREELKAKLAQIDDEIRSNPDFLISMKRDCSYAEVEKKLVFDQSSGEIVHRDSIVYRNLWDEKCDPDDVPISRLIDSSPTAQRIFDSFYKSRPDSSGESKKVPVPQPVMKAVGDLLARIQQEIRDSRHERIRKQVLERLRERAKFTKVGLGSPTSARFVRKRSYRT